MRVGPSHYGSDRHESSVQKADRIVKEETERLGWHENELRTNEALVSMDFPGDGGASVGNFVLRSLWPNESNDPLLNHR